MLTLPRARTSDLVVQELDHELLVYDLRTDVAVSLNESARRVFAACDGKTRIDSLRSRHADLSEASVELALRELSRFGLLEETLPSDGRSRRQLLKTAALTAAAIPIVAGLVVPTSVAAQSCLAGGEPCNVNLPAACCSAVCDSNGGNPICTVTCLAGGATCDTNNPGACCSNVCLGNGGNPICDTVCTPNGGSCSVNDPGLCCSGLCSSNGGNPICVPG